MIFYTIFCTVFCEFQLDKMPKEKTIFYYRCQRGHCYNVENDQAGLLDREKKGGIKKWQIKQRHAIPTDLQPENSWRGPAAAFPWPAM